MCSTGTDRDLKLVRKSTPEKSEEDLARRSVQHSHPSSSLCNLLHVSQTMAFGDVIIFSGRTSPCLTHVNKPLTKETNIILAVK
jgi:hypothetical protein